MKITDLLALESIDLQGNPESKTEAIEQMVRLMEVSGKLLDREGYKRGVIEREEEGTTGIGDGIAIPHCRSEAVKTPGLAAMVVKHGVDYDSLDGEPVHLIFLIAAPNTKDNVHLQVLSKLAGLLMDDTFVERLKNAKNNEEFLEIIDNAERVKDREETAESSATKLKSEAKNKHSLKFLAVTACPTGIAHTYMAAESLEKKAKEAGHVIKVETRGSGGVKNTLSVQEIAEADCIIVAADVQVPMERFHGKKVILCKVADGIGKAADLIKKAETAEIPVYQSNAGRKSTIEVAEKENAGRQIYKHLMSGVSHMLPFVVGGGILIAIAFLIDGLRVDLSTVADKTTFGSITPLAALFKSIGGTAFSFMLPILAGFIAMSIADRPGLALGFVGGAIAASGKSGFLGAMAAGFLAGYIIVLLRKLTAKLPEKLDGLRPILIYPLLGILAIGIIVIYIIEPVFGAVNTALNSGLASMSSTSSILLGLLLGGMMAVDLGGPVNKAAYVFGTASIAAGNYPIMAAVMVGGMVPPCAIALATILYKNKFTSDERKSGPMNFIMGLAFISEGAIPFAASDPLRVLPSLIVGSAISGGLSMAFRCTLMAPHGGIFVFPVVGNALLYLLSLTIGTVISAVLLGILKKPVIEITD
ncbi:PTS fructose transporter subunit IIC [Anaerocolumna cellulosilytica]|uniref:PTS fructose transporter subunit IIC n=1 Tax=Anaerocolumna cellulosilytica TaxID=433286 RepID=A0A6S6R5Q9_9FIRM|nr:PTS fructose transporter subunit IIABC [Anaerocolumna cellulosilytica]MBB5194660.1 PTS system fructose-specific IIC component [Anaerocolumna cellulosilytica]BCJ94378.1 PTS fructose transporter subunit IIC [Anaerocolumna cellulosilytica]